MSLDPHLAGVLQMLAASGAKPIHESTPQEARAGFLAFTAGSLTPDQHIPVATVAPIRVEGATGLLGARVYHPLGSGPFPTVAFFHGGGYVVGDLDTHDNMCRAICQISRVVVVSVDYRLAPEHPFPAGIEDAVAATRWIVAHTDELGGNAVVAVAGDSAGGNFAAGVAQRLRDDGISLAAQLLIYPAVDHVDARHPSIEQNSKGYFLEAETMAWFYRHYAGKQADTRDVRLAPMLARSLAGLAPAVVVTAQYDPLRDEGEAYAAALQKAGVPADLVPGPGMIHGFFDMGRWSPGAQRIIEQALRRFGEVIRGD